MSDRRKSTRVPFSYQVRYKTVDAFLTQFAENLSDNGIFIKTDKPPQMFTKVDVEFCPPNSQEVIQVSGEVQRIDTSKDGKTAGIYIEFQDLSSAEKQQINQIVQSIMGKHSHS